jgi:hypothetical protein
VATFEVSAAVRIRVSDKDRVDDLKAYLESAECSVRVVGQVTLDVSIPRAPSDSQALREISVYLKAWRAMNPGTYARVVGEGETR